MAKIDNKERPLVGQVAIITGASRGIGKAAALALAAAGADISVCARSAGITEVAAEARAMGGRALARRCDITRGVSVDAWLRVTAHKMGRIDIIVNNAAILGPRVPLVDYPEADFERVLRINLVAGFRVIKSALRHSMLSQRRGVIINVSSGAGRVGKALGGAYTVSKFALEGLTQVAAAELKPQGIAVCSLSPGTARTAMRAAWAPDEDPNTVTRPEALGQHFVRLAQLDLSDTGRSFGITAENDLREIPRSVPGR